MEDPNAPSVERIALLERLQNNMGGEGVPPYFWAACQICDLASLEKWVEIARISPEVVWIFAKQTPTMGRYCK